MSEPELTHLAEHGYALLPAFLPPAERDRLRAHTETLLARSAAGAPAGIRNLLGEDDVLTRLADDGPFRAVARQVLGPAARPVRMILFDKTPETNWGVPWQQDRTIAVRGEARPAGYGPWSVKDGVVHVEPPRNVLERMVTLRLHLDPCGPEQGPLRVAAGTHRSGIVPERERDAAMEGAPVVECVADACDLLLMRPLLFHSSRRAAVPSRRRVVHVEYAAAELAQGLIWFFAAPIPPSQSEVL